MPLAGNDLPWRFRTLRVHRLRLALPPLTGCQRSGSAAQVSARPANRRPARAAAFCVLEFASSTRNLVFPSPRCLNDLLLVCLACAIDDTAITATIMLPVITSDKSLFMSAGAVRCCEMVVCIVSSGGKAFRWPEKGARRRIWKGLASGDGRCPPLERCAPVVHSSALGLVGELDEVVGLQTDGP